MGRERSASVTAVGRRENLAVPLVAVLLLLSVLVMSEPLWVSGLTLTPQIVVSSVCSPLQRQIGRHQGLCSSILLCLTL